MYPYEFEKAGLFGILEPHQGKKILLRWEYSGWTAESGEWDGGIEELVFLREL